MSTPAVQDTTVQPTTVQPQATNNQPTTNNAKNYLNRTAEALKPETISCLAKKHILWKVAAVVSAVALFALAIATLATSIALTVTGVLAPVAAIVGVAGYVGLGLLAGFVGGTMWRAGENNKAQLEFSKKLAEHHDPLKSLTPAQIRENLTAKGLQDGQIPAQDDALRTLTPLIARQDMLQAKIDGLTTEREAKIAEINSDLSPASQTGLHSTPATLSNVYYLRNQVVRIDDNIAKTKVEAAFVNAVLQRPQFAGDTKDVYHFTNVDPINRALGQHADQNPSATEILVQFKNRQHAPLTVTDVRNSTVAQLSQRILAAMAA